MSGFMNKFTKKMKKMSGQFGEVAKAVKNKDLDQGLKAAKVLQDEVDQTASNVGNVVRDAAVDTLAQGKVVTDKVVENTKKTVKKWTPKNK